MPLDFELLMLGTLVALVVTVGLPAVAQKADKMDKGGIIFEIYKDKGGDFRYRIKQGDTQLGMSSKGYESKDDIMKVITTIQKEAAKAKVIQVDGGKDKDK
jgi:uncharacterized protein YegP (UPF0339 family)